MTTTIKYEAARAALEAARAVDEVLLIRDQAEMLRVYARQASDKQMIADAVELRERAERRLGEVMALQRETVGLNRGLAGSSVTGSARNPVKDTRPTLREAGIDKRLADKARRSAAMPEPMFEEHVEQVRKKIANLPRTMRSTVEKKLKRAERERELAGKIVALPDERYGVILADPEWPWEAYSEDGMDRAAANHYPTSPIAVIKARDVASIAAADCVLFLWSTVPLLHEALLVLVAWGFAYKSHVIWDKQITGNGFWFVNRHEVLLVGTRGHPPAPAPGTLWPSVIKAKPTVHSAKPAVFHELIESYFPNLPKIELNARRKRAGWTVWGNEVPQ